ncbi:MAG: AmmeMemoRadiSam system radical SAM enzyme [Candidatus Aenigmatarchaeota archaeon]
MQEALFWTKKDKNVQCILCPRKCIIPENLTGYCGVRKNVNGKLHSLVYGKLCAINIDPIEKKPLFMFAPGTQCLSIATVGCNLGCKFCQNWEISHPPEKEVFGENVTPERVVDMGKELPGIAYTYTEPTIMFEFAYDVMKLAKKSGLYNVWVSNGYTNPEPIKLLSKFMDAINVDYKGDENFYKRVCDARLEPVQNALKLYKRLGVWIEVTNLVIPGYNDDKNIILEMVRWIRENLGRETPLHFSAYYPAYKMTAPPTPVETLEKAAKIADEYLDYVYIGNVRHERENTFCPKCKTMLIKRIGFFVEKFYLKRKNSKFLCPNCGHSIPIAGAKWIEKLSKAH